MECPHSSVLGLTLLMKTPHFINHLGWLALALSFTFIFSPLTQAQLKIGAHADTISANTNFEVEADNGTKMSIRRTDGNVGIGTATPSSSLTVNGSFSGGFVKISSAAYQLSTSDFAVCWAGTTAGILTLPNGGDIKGRVYFIRNGSPNGQSMTLTAPTGETIGTTRNLVLDPGGSLVVIATGLAAGPQWETIQQMPGQGSVAGSYVTGYNLAGLGSVTHTIITGTQGSAGTWTAPMDMQDETDTSSDLPSSQMATLMNSLPNGGVIKIRFPNVDVQYASGYSVFDFGLPDASSYVGKTFYLYQDISQSSGIRLTSTGGYPGILFAGSVFGSGSDQMEFTTYGSIDSTNVALTAGSGTANLGRHIYHSAVGLNYRPVSTPIYKLTAVNADQWYLEADTGRYVHFN